MCFESCIGLIESVHWFIPHDVGCWVLVEDLTKECRPTAHVAEQEDPGNASLAETILSGNKECLPLGLHGISIFRGIKAQMVQTIKG